MCSLLTFATQVDRTSPAIGHPALFCSARSKYILRVCSPDAERLSGSVFDHPSRAHAVRTAHPVRPAVLAPQVVALSAALQTPGVMLDAGSRVRGDAWAMPYKRGLARTVRLDRATERAHTRDLRHDAQPLNIPQYPNTRHPCAQADAEGQTAFADSCWTRDVAAQLTQSAAQRGGHVRARVAVTNAGHAAIRSQTRERHQHRDSLDDACPSAERGRSYRTDGMRTRRDETDRAAGFARGSATRRKDDEEVTRRRPCLLAPHGPRARSTRHTSRTIASSVLARSCAPCPLALPPYPCPRSTRPRPRALSAPPLCLLALALPHAVRPIDCIAEK